MKLWIKHPRSKSYDAMLTIAVYTVVAVLFKYFFNGVEISYGKLTLNLGTTDAALVAALLGPTLGAYAARKFKDPIASKTVEQEVSETPEEAYTAPPGTLTRYEQDRQLKRKRKKTK